MADFVIRGRALIDNITVSKAAQAQLRNLAVNLNVTQAVQSLNQLGKAITNIQNRITALGTTSNSAIGKVNNLGQTAQRATQQVVTGMTQANRSANSLLDTIVDITQKALIFRTAAIGINTVTDSISNALSFLRDFDQILIDVRKVTGQSNEELAVFGDRLFEAASKVGLAIEDVAENFKTIVQAGFQGEQALKIVNIAAEGAATGALSFAEATEFVIQAATQFEFTGDKLAGIFDKIAIAESAAAVSAQDIQEAFKRSASSLLSVNTSFEESIGLITALQEATRRGGGVVGTSLRSIATRIFAGDTREAIESLGIQVADLQGNLRPFIQVLEDLASRFSKLTESQRVQAATTIAGRQQFESFLSLVNQVGRAQEITALQTDVQGAAAAKAKLQTEAFNGQLNILRNNLLQVVRTFDKTIPIQNIFKGILVTINNLVTSFGGLGATILALVGSFSALRGLSKLVGRGLAPKAGQAGFGQLVGSPTLRQTGGAGKFQTTLAGLIDTLFSVSLLKSVTSQIGSFRGALPGVGIQFKALGAALKVFAQNPIFRVGTILAAVTVFDDLAQVLRIIPGVTTAAANEFGEVATTFATTFALTKNGLVAAGFTLAKIAKDFFNVFSEEARNAATRAESLGLGKEAVQAARGAEIFAKSGDTETSKLIRNFEVEFQRGLSQISPQTGRILTEVLNETLTQSFTGVEPASQAIRESLVKALQDVIGVSKETANALISTDEFFRRLSDATGESASNLTEFTERTKEFVASLTPEDIPFNLKSFFSEGVDGLRPLLETLKNVGAAANEAALAQEIYAKNITDPIERAQLEAANTLKNLQGDINATVQELERFRTSTTDLPLDTFTRAIDVIRERLERASQQGIDSEEFIGGATAELQGQFGNEIVLLIQNFKSLLPLVEANSVALNTLAAEEAKVAQARRESFVDRTLMELERLRDLRFTELDAVRELSEELGNFTGKTDFTRQELGNIAESFSNLGQLAKEGIDPSRFLEIAEASNAVTLPIEKAVQAFQTLGATVAQQVGALEERKNLLLEENALLGDSFKEREQFTKNLDQINQIQLQQDKLILSSREKLIDAANRIEERRRENQERTLKATDRVTDAENRLSLALQGLQVDLDESARKASGEAQEELKKTQQEVVDATKELAEAYQSEIDARFALNDTIADFRLGLALANRETELINGNIVQFSDRIDSIRNAFEEVINQTNITETKRLELLRTSSEEQLKIVQGTIDEIRGLGGRLFTAGPELGGELIQGFAAIRDILQQVQAQGGPEALDLNQFGNQILALPQQIREQIAQALSFLPQNAEIGGFSRTEIEDLLFGAAVGESDVGLVDIRDLTVQQIDLITEIAELNRQGIIASSAQLGEAVRQTELAQMQLELAKLDRDEAEQNVQAINEEIRIASTQVGLIQQEIGRLLDTDIKKLDTELIDQTRKQTEEHKLRLDRLGEISANTGNLISNLASLSNAVQSIGFIESAAKGHIPNFARGNKGEFAALYAAYRREKSASPAGSYPVVANSSELIIPTRNRGQIPNYQRGNIDLDNSGIEQKLDDIRAELQSLNTTINSGGGTQNVNATISVNAQERVTVSGAETVGQAVGTALRNSLSGFVRTETIENVQSTILQLFETLRQRGLISAFGEAL